MFNLTTTKRSQLLLITMCVLAIFLFDMPKLIAAPRKQKAKFNVGIVKSSDLRQFNRVVMGTKSNLSSKLYAIHVITIGKKFSVEQIHNFISQKKISLVICLGEVAAVYFTNRQKKVPVLFSLVLNYKRFKFLTKGNVGGVAMEISSQNLFAQFRLLHDGLKKLSLPYHPKASLEIVNEARDSAPRLGIRLAAMPISSPDKIVEYLNKNKSKFDSLWMISDFKLYNPSSFGEVKGLFKFARENKKPVFVSSDVFLKTGGLFSVSVDYLSLGSQLALLTNRVLKGSEKISKIGVALPIGTRTVLNMKVARDLVDSGVLDESVLYDFEADVLYEPK